MRAKLIHRELLTKFYILFSIASFLLCNFISSNAHSEEVASLYSSQGLVEAKKYSQSIFEIVSVGAKFQEQDALRTKERSRAALLFNDGFLVRLNENTVMQIRPRGLTKSAQPLAIDSGKAFFFSRQPESFPEISTPVVSAAVRGTEFVIDVERDQTIVTVLNGRVECKNTFGDLIVNSGEEAVTLRGQAPFKRLIVNPTDAVQWALYYPAIIDPLEFDIYFKGASTEENKAWQILRTGDPRSAFNYLDQIKGELPPSIALIKSAFLLSVGDVPASERILTTLEKDPIFSAPALAQRAIISVVKNNKQLAKILIDKALSINPNSASILLAASFVDQAHFELDKAKQRINLALKNNPGSALLYSRMAELHLGDGELEKAEDTLSKISSEINTNSLSIAGFTALTRGELELAKNYFNDSIKNDTTSGLPHLGLGLTLIKEGNLESGRRELERAVHLEPTVAIYRSYLGKAYFESENESLAHQEYARAIELDPRDPTPYLYRTTLHLAKFRPVDALEDIETSIELNNNRAVFRSQFLLDQDLAVRGASLSETFVKLGFLEAARIEAIKSLNRNYSNFSAHYLLAGSYVNQPSLGQAFITESLVGSLLAPVNFNSILPNFSGDAGLNEYTALFDRPVHRTRVEGVAISKDKTLIGEVTDLGAFGNFAYAASYQGSYRNGPYKNDSQRQNVTSLSLQYQLTPDDSLKLFSGLAVSDSGDRSMPFYHDSTDPDFGEDLDLFVTRLGYHHQFGPQSHLIAQFTYNNEHIHTNDLLEDRLNLANLISQGEVLDSFTFAQTINEDYRQRIRGARQSTQYIYDSNYASLVVGGEYLNARAKQSEKSQGVAEDEDGVVTFPVTTDGRHNQDSASLYLYPTAHLGEWADLSAGIRWSSVDLSKNEFEPAFVGDETDSEVWSPKFGVSFYPTPELTLRTAYFENAGISGPLDRETLEPTAIGGFNQIFDDIFGGTRSRNLGFGADYKIRRSTYFGSEFIGRHVIRDRRFVNTIFNVDLDDSSDSGTERELEALSLDIHGDEKIIKNYIYQVISKSITATFDHSWIMAQDSDFDTFSLETYEHESRTHRYKFGLNFVDPSGWVTYGSGTWRQQGLSDYLDDRNGERDFWILEAGVAYLFPHRRGSVVLNFNNLLDQEFNFEPTGFEPLLISGFNIGLGVSLNF